MIAREVETGKLVKWSNHEGTELTGRVEESPEPVPPHYMAYRILREPSGRWWWMSPRSLVHLIKEAPRSPETEIVA